MQEELDLGPESIDVVVPIRSHKPKEEIERCAVQVRARPSRPFLIWRCVVSAVKHAWHCLRDALDRPGDVGECNIVAIVKAPEHIYCPACGRRRVSKYCPMCGVNVQEAYRRTALQLAQYVVAHTDETRRRIRKQLFDNITTIQEIQEAKIRLAMGNLSRQYEREITMLKARINAMFSQFQNGYGAVLASQGVDVALLKMSDRLARLEQSVAENRQIQLGTSGGETPGGSPPL